MRIGWYQTAMTAALISALMIALPASADFVGMRQLQSGVSGKPASGIFCSEIQTNLKETRELTQQMRWGNYYMHQRYYSPVLGRFVSVDPVAGRAANSQSWNRYSYVLNNPVRLVDLDGEFELEPAAGSQFGQAALDHYAAVLADPDSGAVAKTGAAIGGFLAATWTPETSVRTGMTLATGGIAGLGLASKIPAVVEGIQMGGAVGATTNGANTFVKTGDPGQALMATGSGLLNGSAVGGIFGPLEMTPLTTSSSAGITNMMQQVSTGGSVDWTETAWVTMCGFGGGVTAGGFEGAAKIAAAVVITELGEGSLAVARRVDEENKQ